MRQFRYPGKEFGGYIIGSMKGALQDTLDEYSAEARLAQPLPNGAVRCVACGHRCLVREGKRGVCRVRFNRGGVLRMPWGYVAGMHCDPVEKKPFYHLLPGSGALTFGMLGCDFHCDFCQNWVSSQALRDPMTEALGLSIQKITAEEVAAEARRADANLVVSSYNEPWITAEWAQAIFTQARLLGFRTAFVSNGYATPESLAFLRPWLDAIKIDLKSMRPQTYRKLGGVMQVTLDTIRACWESGLWVEVVTLIVPGMNDEPAELWDAARFLAGLSPDIPWHVTAFHPDYRLENNRPARSSDLLQAAEIGQEAGLRYVYAGNLPGTVRNLEDTACPACRHILIRRRGFSILENKIAETGMCPNCGEIIAGIWRKKK
jgi:pyruvate formate lyase activating enzyme